MAESVASVRSTSTSASMFRAKVAAMKAWRPENPPSNRDRLELYALHKQAVSGDAPTHNTSSHQSVPDRAKLNAWRSKRGMEQAEAVSLYVAECDRQTRVYGTAAAASEASPPPGTPTNTPHANDEQQGRGTTSSSAGGVDGGGGIAGNHLLVPRGLTAVPLLCAAAAESRAAYLSRLSKTPSSQGWWAKQEPLCAEPGTAWAAPEAVLLFFAAKVEALALSVNNNNTGGLLGGLTPPSVVQSFLWPTHNVLLTAWIVLVFLHALVGSASAAARTVLLGSNTTGVPLACVFREEILPAARTAAGLTAAHQALSVRLAGLGLMPFVTICDVSHRGAGGALWPGATLYVAALSCTWWYWACALPTAVAFGIWTAAWSGWCFALIELATIVQ